MTNEKDSIRRRRRKEEEAEGERYLIYENMCKYDEKNMRKQD